MSLTERTPSTSSGQAEGTEKKTLPEPLPRNPSGAGSGNAFCIEIGDVALRVRSSMPVAHRDPDGSYRDFFAVSGHADPVIDFELIAEEPAVPDGSARLFDADETWSLFMQGDDRLLAWWGGSRGGSPMWLARVNPGFDRVTVSCGPRLLSGNNGGREISNPVRYPLDQWLLMHLLASRCGAIVHACGVRVGGKAGVFLGKSGAGKTTLARLLSDRKDASVFSDDRVILRMDKRGTQAYGTPWPGEAGSAKNEQGDLKGLFCLKKGTRRGISQLSPGAALEMLLPVASVPWYDSETASRLLTFFDKLVTNVPVYEFEFDPTAESAAAAADHVAQG